MEQLKILTLSQIGYLSSIGTLSYAIGKFTNGFLTDYIGGKKIFTIGMFGSVCFSVLFGMANNYSFFILFWSLNCFFLSMGWSGIIKISSYWFNGSNRGTIMGWMSLNYQGGSTIAKVITTFLLGFPFLVWKGLFIIPALILLVMALIVLFFLKEKPVQQTNDSLVYNDKSSPQLSSDTHATHSKWQWIDLLKSPLFMLIVWGSAGITLVRTFFDDFTALWLSTAGMDNKIAGYISALFTIGGMVGSILAGYVSDKIWNGNRGPVMILSGLCLGIVLFFSGFFPKNSIAFSIIFFTIAGVFIYGIYSVLAGISAIDFGGNVAPSTAAGIIDGVGYLAASLAGVLAAQVKRSITWENLIMYFAIMTIIVTITLVPLWKQYPDKSVL